jgi:hypothetical protein
VAIETPSIIGDVDLRASLLLDAADDLAAWSDDVTDLVGWNLDGDDSRCVLAHLGARLGDHLLHLVEDVVATFPGLFKGLGKDHRIEPGHLDIHLQTGDAVTGLRRP